MGWEGRETTWDNFDILSLFDADLYQVSSMPRTRNNATEFCEKLIHYDLSFWSPWRFRSKERAKKTLFNVVKVVKQ